MTTYHFIVCRFQDKLHFSPTTNKSITSSVCSCSPNHPCNEHHNLQGTLDSFFLFCGKGCMFSNYIYPTMTSLLHLAQMLLLTFSLSGYTDICSQHHIDTFTTFQSTPKCDLVQDISSTFFCFMEHFQFKGVGELCIHKTQDNHPITKIYSLLNSFSNMSHRLNTIKSRNKSDNVFVFSTHVRSAALLSEPYG